MRKLSSALLIGLLCSVALTGCGTPWISAAFAQQAEPGTILFEDDFSDPRSGWRTLIEDDSVIAYHEGGLRFIINKPAHDLWSLPGRWYRDVRVEVLATMKNGPMDNDFGILCRYQDEDNFYAFMASSDGYAGIVKVEQGDYQVISAETLEFEDAILQGQASNHLRAECSGNRLTFSINDQLVAEAIDDAFTEGDIGLVAGAFSEPGVDILFDNFVVLQP